jgi:hypothetical protein
MPGGLKAGRRIQGTGDNGNARFVPGIPEQTGPTLAAKPAMHIGGFVSGGVKPPQCVGSNQDQVFPIRCSVGACVAVKPPAFAAVAVDYIHQLIMNFEPDPTAKASACRYRFRLL